MQPKKQYANTFSVYRLRYIVAHGEKHGRQHRRPRPHRRAHQKEAAAVLAAIGLTVSDAFRLMMVRIASGKALPFDPLVPNAETVAAMKEAREGRLPRFRNVDDVLADLNERD